MKTAVPFLSYRQQMFLKTLIEQGWVYAARLDYAKMTMEALIRKKMLYSVDARFWYPTGMALDWYEATWRPRIEWS